jgi:hypothetical protein
VDCRYRNARDKGIKQKLEELIFEELTADIFKKN